MISHVSTVCISNIFAAVSASIIEDWCEQIAYHPSHYERGMDSLQNMGNTFHTEMVDQPERHCILVLWKFQILQLWQYLSGVYVLIGNVKKI
jgi:hypothetical protein